MLALLVSQVLYGSRVLVFGGKVLGHDSASHDSYDHLLYTCKHVRVYILF